MLKSWMAPAAAALAVLLLAGTVDTAEARKGGGWGGGGGAKFSGGGGKFYGGGGGKFYGGGAKFYGGGGKFYYGGNKFYGGKIHHGNRFARFHHRHRFVGVPLAAYGYYAYSDGYSCAWLRRRAVIEGSSYWWNRYYACLDGYYY